MREFPTFEYMRFAKTHHHRGAYNFMSSGMPELGPGELPFRPAELPLNTGDPYGMPELKDAVARHAGVSTEEVFLAPGTSGVNFFLAGALLSPGDEAVVERPTYEVLHLLPELFGATAVRWDRRPENGFRPAVEDLRPLLTERTKAVFLSDPHNPSGTRVPPEEMEAIARLTLERGVPLVVDEVYLDSVPGARTVRRLGGLTVATSSLTKVYGLGGLRIGWALAPPALVEGLDRFHDLATVVCPVPSQALARIALEGIEALRDRALEAFRDRFPVVDGWVRETEGLDWTPPEGTLFGFPKLPSGVSATDLFELLRREYDTWVVPGRYFDGYDDHFRLGFGVERSKLEAGLRRIGKALERLSAR